MADPTPNIWQHKWSQVPKPPNPNVGYVLYALFRGCAPAPYILVGLFTFDAMTAWWSIFSPNWKDEVKQGPRRGSWLHEAKSILFEADEAAPAWWIDYGDFAVGAFEALDFISFWLVVIVSTIDGLIEWSTTVWEMSTCAPKPNELYYYSDFPDGDLIGPLNAWIWGPAWLHGHSNGLGENFASEWTVPAYCTMNVSMAVSFINGVAGNKIGCDCRIVNLTKNEIIQQHNWTPEHVDKKNHSGVLLSSYPTGEHPQTFQVQWRATTSNLLITPVEGHCAIEYLSYPPQ